MFFLSSATLIIICIWVLGNLTLCNSDLKDESADFYTELWKLSSLVLHYTFVKNCFGNGAFFNCPALNMSPVCWLKTWATETTTKNCKDLTLGWTSCTQLPNYSLSSRLQSMLNARHWEGSLSLSTAVLTLVSMTTVEFLLSLCSYRMNTWKMKFKIKIKIKIKNT